MPYIPSPTGIWPLSRSSLIDEPTSDMFVSKEDIGIDTLVTPAGFLGSPLLSPLKLPDALINSHLIVDYKNPTPSWPGITIMFWLRFDDDILPTVSIPILVSCLDMEQYLYLEFYVFLIFQLILPGK